MSVLASDLKAYLAAVMPVALTTASVGGAISATQITGSSIGEVHFTMPSAGSGGGARTQYSKFFVKNTNGSDDLTLAKVFLANALDPGPSGDHTVSVQSDSALDDNTFKARFIGFDPSGNPLQEEVILNGTTLVVSTATFKDDIVCVESRDATTGALKPTNGTWTIRKNAVTKGVIPPTYYSANGEISIGLPATLNDTGTTTDAATAPGGITFTRPRDAAGALSVANSETLTAGAAQGIWSRWICAERRKASPDMQVVLEIDGATL